ncbi:MAG: hypothetical protein PVF70_05800 [Anaerolineales bacterium]
MKKEGAISFWLRWVTATAVSEMVGLSVSFGIGYGLGTLSMGGRPLLPPLAFAGLMILTGIFEGLVVGTAQWCILRRRVPRIGWLRWGFATTLGAFVAWVLGMLPSTLMEFGAPLSNDGAPGLPEYGIYLMAAAMGAVLGIVLALPQWVVLRRHVHRAAWWIPANSLAWLLGMPIIFAGAGWITEQCAGFGLILSVLGMLLVAGAVVGAVHGAALVRLLDSEQM